MPGEAILEGHVSIPGWFLWNQGNGVEEQIRVGLKGESEEHFFFFC